MTGQLLLACGLNRSLATMACDSCKDIPSLPEGLAALHHELKIPERYAAERGFKLHREAQEHELVQIATNDEGRPIRLMAPAVQAWLAMRHAAEAQNITLLPISGFRSVERQAEIIRGKLSGGQSLAEILRYVAAPGYSEHHTGRALDIGSPEHLELDEDFARTTAFAWLSENAAGFGYRLTYPVGNVHGIGYEPWHWCWHRA